MSSRNRILGGLSRIARLSYSENARMTALFYKDSVEEYQISMGDVIGFINEAQYFILSSN
jgi:hypothetical protein